MLQSSILFLHIAGGSAAILAGYAALAVRKGAPAHRVAGQVFVGAVLVMAVFAGALGAVQGQWGNVIAGLFAGYLVLSGWGAMRRAPGTAGRLEAAGFLFAAGLAVASVLGALQAASGAHGADVPVPARFIFAAVAAWAAALDLQVLRRGGVTGFERLRRHLWRMCAGMFIATGSFFLGQMDEIPRALHGPQLWILALAPLAALVFWMIRTRRRRPRLRAAAAVP